MYRYVRVVGAEVGEIEARRWWVEDEGSGFDCRNAVPTKGALIEDES
jgi:hypothetical protein